MEVAAQGLTRAGGSRESLAVRVFCCAILGAALAVGVVLVATGADRPGLAPLLLLSLAAALCINRFALFPTEHAATAEAAVLLAAVVGFRAGAVFLGPLAVGFLVGPLDLLHWEQRSFLRMAHNAGNRGLSVLAASAGFVAVRTGAGSSTFAIALAVAAAAACFAAVDALLSMTLLTSQGTPRRAAVQHILEVDALTLPIACYGAAVGFLAGELGWWATALALVPAAFIPELVFARARWRATVVRDIACAVGVVAVLVALAFVAPLPDTATLALLVAVGVLAGAELAVDGSTPVPPLLALVVVAAVVVTHGDRTFFAAAVVGITGTFTSWWCAGLRPRFHALRAVATAGSAALASAAIFEAAPRSIAGAALIAAAAGIAFEAVATMAGRARRARSIELLWAGPILLVSVAWSFSWQIIGLGGGALFALAAAAAGAAMAWWGAPPWRSRLLGRRMGRLASTRHRAVLGATSALAVCMATGSAAVGRSGDGRLVLLWAAVGVGETALAMALVGVRQWRFAPRPRAISLSAGLTAAAALALAYPALAADGSGWAVVLVAALLAVGLLIGHAPGARADAAVPARDGARAP